MKKNLFAAALLAMMSSGVQAFAYTPEEPEDVTLSPANASSDAWTDTIAVIKNAHHIVVCEQGSKTVLTVHGSGSDENYYYRYGLEPRVDSVSTPKLKVGVDVPFAGNLQGNSSTLRFLKNIYVGANIPVGPGKNLKAGWEIGVGEIIGFGYTPNKGNTSLSVGFGFCYRSISAANSTIFDKKGDTLILTPISEQYGNPSASLNFWQLQFPLLMSQKISGNVGFNFGVLINLNVSAKAQSQWESNETTVKCEIENLHQRFLTPDIFATIGLRNMVGGYVKFSPMNAMHRYVGPRMSMISAGVNFNF